MNLKIGDKVRCVDPPSTGQLNSNEEYTITWIEPFYHFASVNKWPMMAWHESRFELIPYIILPTNSPGASK